MHFKRLLPALLGLLATVSSAAAVPTVRRAGDDTGPLPTLKPTQVGSVTTPDGTVLGYRLYNHSKKAATPLILVGGLFQLQGDWEKAVPHFAENRPVLTFDNRGIGASTVTNYSMVTIPKMIEDIQHLTQHFGWRRINLAGISMGAIISQQFAANYAHKVTLEHLVLMSSGFKSSIKSPFDDMVGQWLTELSQPPTEEQWSQFTDKLFQACLTPEFVRDQPERVKEFLKEIHEAGPNRSPQALLAQSKANSHYDFTKLLKKIRVPTLVLHGTKDIVLLPENGRQIHAEIKGSKYIEYPDGGHILFETDLQSLFATVKFLNDKE